MRRGGSKVQNVDLDGYEAKAARQERQVPAKAWSSRKELNRGMIEWSRPSGRSAHPSSPYTAGGILEAEAQIILLGPCMMSDYLQESKNK
jgi:hypothetical protein